MLCKTSIPLQTVLGEPIYRFLGCCRNNMPSIRNFWSRIIAVSSSIAHGTKLMFEWTSLSEMKGWMDGWVTLFSICLSIYFEQNNKCVFVFMWVCVYEYFQRKPKLSLSRGRRQSHFAYSPLFYFIGSFFTWILSALWPWQKISTPSASPKPSSSNNEGFVLARLPLDVSFPRPHSLLWLFSGVLMGEGTQTVESREPCLWPGANSTSQAGVDSSVSVLGYREHSYLSWSSSYLQPAPWESSRSGFLESFAPCPGEGQNWRGWVGDGRGTGSESQGVKNFTASAQGAAVATAS